MPNDEKLNPLKKRLLEARIKRIVRETPPDLLPLIDDWIHALEKRDFVAAEAAARKLSEEIERRRNQD
jgi:hypothetical protein